MRDSYHDQLDDILADLVHMCQKVAIAVDRAPAPCWTPTSISMRTCARRARASSEWAMSPKMVVTAGHTLSSRSIESAEDLQLPRRGDGRPAFQPVPSDAGASWDYGVEAAVDVALLGRYTSGSPITRPRWAAGSSMW